MKSIFKLLIYFIFFVAAYFLLLLCLGIDARQLIDFEKVSMVKKILHNAGLWILIVSVLYIGRIKIEKRSLSDFGFNRDKYLKMFLLGLSFGVGSVVIYNIFLRIFDIISFQTEFINHLVVLKNYDFIVRTFFLLLLVAFFEEVFFRGFIYDVLKENLPIWLVIGLSSIIFAGFHFPNNYMLYIGLFLCGLILAYSRYLLNSIEFTCGLHFGWILLLHYFSSLGIVKLNDGIPMWLVGHSLNPAAGVIGICLISILFPAVKILSCSCPDRSGSTTRL